MGRFVRPAKAIAVTVLAVLAAGCTTGSRDPTQRIAAVAESVGERMYVIGGMGTGATLSSSTDVFDPATNSWTSVAPMPTPRATAASAIADGWIYVIGGRSGAGVLGTVERYNPKTDSWASCSDMPTPRWCHRAVAWGGKILVLGGISGTGNARTALDLVEAYNPATDTWTKGSAMPQARHSFGARIVGNRLFIVGGKSAAAVETTAGPPITEKVACLDLSTGLWRSVTSAPRPRVNPSVVALSDVLYVIGGMDRQGGLPTIIDIYDPAADEWSEGAAIRQARSGQCAAVVNGTAYLVGGTATRYGAGSLSLPSGIEAVPLAK